MHFSLVRFTLNLPFPWESLDLTSVGLPVKRHVYPSNELFKRYARVYRRQTTDHALEWLRLMMKSKVCLSSAGDWLHNVLLQQLTATVCTHHCVKDVPTEATGRIGCLHDSANVQQTSSKCIQNTRADAGRLLDRVKHLMTGCNVIRPPQRTQGTQSTQRNKTDTTSILALWWLYRLRHLIFRVHCVRSVIFCLLTYFSCAACVSCVEKCVECVELHEN